MNGRRIAWGAAAAVAAALAAWGVLRGRPPDLRESPAARNGSAVGPELLLRDVDMREAHDNGAVYSLRADRVAYAMAGRTLLAGKVVIGAPASSGEILVSAPRAEWDTEAGRVRLDEGASASDGQGLAATVARGTLELASRRFLGRGHASVSGNGFSIVGDNLAWHWSEGRISIQSPKGRIAPAALPGRKG